MSFTTASTILLELKKTGSESLCEELKIVLVAGCRTNHIIGCPPSQIPFFSSDHPYPPSQCHCFFFLIYYYGFCYLFQCFIFIFFVSFLSTDLCGRVTQMNSILNRKCGYEKLNKEMTKI